MITVRRIQTGEVDLYKQIRLASLQDAPYAFETTYESAIQRTDDIWLERAESGMQGTDGATFFAISDNLPIGMAALFRSQDQASTGELMQVWVHPDYRGTRVAWALMDAVFAWAQENGYQTIIAGVTNVNARALTFYNKYGFSTMDKPAMTESDSVYLAKAVR